MVETLTKVVTSSITNTKLAVATLAAIMAGGAALATVPIQSTTTPPPGNYFTAAYCRQNGAGATVQFPSSSQTYSFRSGQCYYFSDKTPYTCFDGDGRNVRVATTSWETNLISGEVTMKSDACVGATAVSESYCSVDGRLLTATTPCPYNYFCSNGACLASSTTPPASQYSCYDGDGGQNVYVATTTIEVNLSNGGRSIGNDSCVTGTPNLVSESYCNANNRLSSAQVFCPSSTVCSNGACVATTPAHYCTDSDGGENFRVKGTVQSDRMGGATGVDFCGSDVGLHGRPVINEYYCDAEQKLMHISLECDLNDVCTNGACVATSTPTTTLTLWVSKVNRNLSIFFGGENLLGEVSLTSAGNSRSNITVTSLVLFTAIDNASVSRWRLSFPNSSIVSDWVGVYGSGGKVTFSPSSTSNYLIIPATQTYKALVKADVFRVSSTYPGAISTRVDSVGVSPAEVNVLGLPLSLGGLSSQ